MAALLLAMPAAAQEKPLKIIVVDVEGGAATLFLTPEGHSLLVDTGWPPGNGQMPSPDGSKDSSDRIVMAAKKLGIKKLDYVLVTHYHDDHSGGAAALAKKIPVGTFIDHGPNGDPLRPGTPPERVLNTSFGQYELYQQTLKGHKRLIAKAGDVIKIGSLTNTIVASDARLIEKPLAGAGAVNLNCYNTPPRDIDDNVNENTRSVASLLRFGSVSIAQFGDLSWDMEYQLACPIDRLGKVNLLIVTQHGSANVSNNAAHIAAMAPDVAIMPNGGKKDGAGKRAGLLAAARVLQVSRTQWRPELRRQSQSATGRHRQGRVKAMGSAARHGSWHHGRGVQVGPDHGDQPAQWFQQNLSSKMSVIPGEPA
jgi:beta-lactamase superfamily II metal-dependent hydrolase